VKSNTEIILDIGTSQSHQRLMNLYEEVKRIIYTVRRNIGYDDFLNIDGNIRNEYTFSEYRKLYKMKVVFTIREIGKKVEV